MVSRGGFSPRGARLAHAEACALQPFERNRPSGPSLVRDSPSRAHGITTTRGLESSRDIDVNMLCAFQNGLSRGGFSPRDARLAHAEACAYSHSKKESSVRSESCARQSEARARDHNDAGAESLARHRCEHAAALFRMVSRGGFSPRGARPRTLKRARYSHSKKESSVRSESCARQSESRARDHNDSGAESSRDIDVNTLCAFPNGVAGL